MQIENMTDQEVLEYMKDRSASNTVVKGLASIGYEHFYKAHNITIRCPHCLSPYKTKNGTNDNGVIRYKCKVCGKGFSITSNTIFEGLNYSVAEMVNAVKDVLNEGHTITNLAAKTKRENININSAWLLEHKIVHILAKMGFTRLSGTIQMDEKYFRETQKGCKPVSFLEPGTPRDARIGGEASTCGIYGPEFINVLCAVDEHGHYWAKCVCLGPLYKSDLMKINDFHGVDYICTDALKVYSDWCKEKNYKHYIEPSTYRKERSARGYVAPSREHILSQQQYELNDRISRQLYAEHRYPYVEDGHHYTYDEFKEAKKAQHWTINAVNSFHKSIENFISSAERGVSSKYLPDYIGAITFIENYKHEKGISKFNTVEAEEVLAKMLKHTIINKDVPSRKEIMEMNISHLRHPNKGTYKFAEKMVNKVREIYVEPEKKNNDDDSQEEVSQTANFEGDSDIAQYIFNKRKFFAQLGTKRINELCKLYHIYNRGDHKAQKVEKLSALPNAEDILLNEIITQKYLSVDRMRKVFAELPEKRKRGRPKKDKTTTP